MISGSREIGLERATEESVGAGSRRRILNNYHSRFSISAEPARVSLQPRRAFDKMRPKRRSGMLSSANSGQRAHVPSGALLHRVVETVRSLRGYSCGCLLGQATRIPRAEGRHRERRYRVVRTHGKRDSTASLELSLRSPWIRAKTTAFRVKTEPALGSAFSVCK